MLALPHPCSTTDTQEMPLCDLAWSGSLDGQVEAMAKLLEREEWAHKKTFTANGLRTKIPKYVSDSLDSCSKADKQIKPNCYETKILLQKKLIIWNSLTKTLK